MLKYICCCCLWFAFSFNAFAQDYLTTKPLKGESIKSMLTRYNLHQYDCNFSKFYSLNKLTAKSLLKLNETYYLPIEIFTYNDVSIRSTINDNDYKKAVRIRDYNINAVRAGNRKQDYRVSKILWVPYHEQECKKTSTPTEPTIVTNNGRVFPLFGKEYENVPLESNDLKGKVFYIVSGHGGPDPGAVNRATGRKMCEDEYAYDIALRLTRNLVANGATAYMIIRDENDGIRSGSVLNHDKDEVCYPNKRIPSEQKKRLNQRSDAINTLYEKHKKQGVTEQYAVMIHIDSRSTAKRLDLFFYYFPASRSGKNAALTLRKTIREQYDRVNKNRGYTGTVKPRDLHMLRETKPTAVYIELGNIKNVADQQRFLKESNRQALANWLAKGMKRL